MAYVVRFSDGVQEHELRAATIDAAQAIIRFLSEANVQSVTVCEEDDDLIALPTVAPDG